MSRTQKLDRQLHRMLAGRRIAEVRRQMSPGGCNGLFIALDDGTVAILWLWPGEMTPLPRRIIQTQDALDRARKQSRGEWRKFY
ncbi:MAG: hypothetical protein Q8R16_00375, partial [bacterium]|nr:hypothetical protein [bacterium]